MSDIQSPIEAVICYDCNSKQIFKHEGKTITVYHDCVFGEHQQEHDKELIGMIASSIDDYPNGDGDITIMTAVTNLINRYRNGEFK